MVKPDKVFEYGRRLIDMEPRFFGGYMWVGTAYRVLKKYPEAISTFQEAVKLNHSPFNLYTLGSTYARMGEIAKARDVIEEIQHIEGAFFLWLYSPKRMRENPPSKPMKLSPASSQAV